VIDLASLTLQLSCARLPAEIVSGLASKVVILGGAPFSVPGADGR